MRVWSFYHLYLTYLTFIELRTGNGRESILVDDCSTLRRHMASLHKVGSLFRVVPTLTHSHRSRTDIESGASRQASFPCCQRIPRNVVPPRLNAADSDKLESTTTSGLPNQAISHHHTRMTFSKKPQSSGWLKRIK